MKKIVVGVDDSECAQRAVRWCADHAPALGAEVIVVHAVPIPVQVAMSPYYALPSPTEDQLEQMRDLVARDWCKPLADAGVPHRVIVIEGSPAADIVEIARREGADLVVAGRRGRGGFAELVLGSTSHQLTHHCDRPLVLVP